MQLDEDLPYAEGGEADPQQGPQMTLASDLHRYDWRTPRLQGYNAILVVVDCLSKWIHTVPIVTSLDSAGVAQCRQDISPMCKSPIWTGFDPPDIPCSLQVQKHSKTCCQCLIKSS